MTTELTNNHPTMRDLIAYMEQQPQEVMDILKKANSDYSILSRSAHLASINRVPMPQTVEALTSFMRYDAESYERLATYLETRETQELYTAEEADRIKDCWKRAYRLKAYVDQLRDLGVVPAPIVWEPEELEDEDETHCFSFRVKGEISAIGKYTQARKEVLTFLKDTRLNEQDNSIMGYCVNDVELEG